LFHHCQAHKNIIQLVEYFEEQERFYLIFEKITGGRLLDHIESRKFFTEQDAALVIKDVAAALEFLHSKGIAHRDLKPENVLCVHKDKLNPVKLCDFDLGSGIKFHSGGGSDTTPFLQTPVGSAEFMAPEIVEAFIEDTEDDFKYDKRCDLWSLGVMMYILLCGYPPFSGSCGAKCGWADGGDCQWCQLNLFHNIQKAKLHFPKRDWAQISLEAKDLIKKLLVKTARNRISAEDVLNHPWLKTNSDLQLDTPARIKENGSAADLSSFAESAAAVNRVVLQHLSSMHDWQSQKEDSPTNCSPNNEDSPPYTMTSMMKDPHDELSPPTDSYLLQRRKSSLLTEETPGGLSPPTVSQLLQRRRHSHVNKCELQAPA